MTGDYCPECRWAMWELLFPGNNGLCLWNTCLYCGHWERVFE